jgi:predicted RNA methylase
MKQFLKYKLVRPLKRRLKILWERLRGLDTLQYCTLEELGLPRGRSSPYSTSGNVHLARVLNTLSVSPEDSVVDLGSGKGGALLTLARYPFGRMAGVEISPALHAVARKNMLRLKLTSVELFQMDAADFTGFDAYNYVYLYNPFGSAVMRPVLEHLGSSLRSRPRRITLLYKNPVCHREIMESGLFEKQAEFPTEYEFKFYLYRSVYP